MCIPSFAGNSLFLHCLNSVHCPGVKAMINFSLLYNVYWPYAHSTHVCVTLATQTASARTQRNLSRPHLILFSSQLRHNRPLLSASAITSAVHRSNVRSQPRWRKLPLPLAGTAAKACVFTAAVGPGRGDGNTAVLSPL